jgi:hypothetical protein
MSEVHKGKVGRLPAEIRFEVNRRLHDGETGPRILRWLNALPQVKAILQEEFGSDAVTPQNLSEWRQGGFKKYLLDLERVDRIKELSQFAMQMAEAAGGSISAGSAAIAGGKILDVLEAADGERLDELIKSITLLRAGDLEDRKIAQRERAIDLKRKHLSLLENRLQIETCEKFLAWFKDSRARDIAESKATNAEKIAALRQAYYSDVDELEQSGKVVLPQ